jgi:DNA replication and repair protein RecF
MSVRGDADAAVARVLGGVCRLTRLEISGVRVLERVGIAPGPGINLLVGGNGAGKTSVLESIHVLGTGRSFRTRELDRLLGHGRAGLSVFGEVAVNSQLPSRIGVSRDLAGGVRLRLDGEDVKGFAQVARRLPLAVFVPESHEIVGGPPERRRALMDWALFHVEPGYGETLQRYRRALRQRNAVLRSGPVRASARAWEAELAEAGERLHAWRAQYAKTVLSYVRGALAGLRAAPLGLAYRPGWNGERPLLSALEESWSGDAARGWSGVGPHMADLSLSVDGQPARHVLSRGEAKALVAGMLVGHVRYLVDASDRRPVVLADEVASELDERARSWFLRELLGLECQVFVTAVERTMVPLEAAWPRTVFHVEQGRVSPLV